VSPLNRRFRETREASLGGFDAIYYRAFRGSIFARRSTPVEDRFDASRRSLTFASAFVRFSPNAKIAVVNYRGFTSQFRNGARPAERNAYALRSGQTLFLRALNLPEIIGRGFLSAAPSPPPHLPPDGSAIVTGDRERREKIHGREFGIEQRSPRDVDANVEKTERTIATISCHARASPLHAIFKLNAFHYLCKWTERQRARQPWRKFLPAPRLQR